MGLTRKICRLGISNSVWSCFLSQKPGVFDGFPVDTGCKNRCFRYPPASHPPAFPILWIRSAATRRSHSFFLKSHSGTQVFVFGERKTGLVRKTSWDCWWQEKPFGERRSSCWRQYLGLCLPWLEGVVRSMQPTTDRRSNICICWWVVKNANRHRHTQTNKHKATSHAIIWGKIARLRVKCGESAGEHARTSDQTLQSPKHCVQTTSCSTSATYAFTRPSQCSLAALKESL